MITITMNVFSILWAMCRIANVRSHIESWPASLVPTFIIFSFWVIFFWIKVFLVKSNFSNLKKTFDLSFSSIKITLTEKSQRLFLFYFVLNEFMWDPNLKGKNKHFLCESTTWIKNIQQIYEHVSTKKKALLNWIYVGAPNFSFSNTSNIRWIYFLNTLKLHILSFLYYCFKHQ